MSTIQYAIENINDMNKDELLIELQKHGLIKAQPEAVVKIAQAFSSNDGSFRTYVFGENVESQEEKYEKLLNEYITMGNMLAERKNREQGKNITKEQDIKDAIDTIPIQNVVDSLKEKERQNMNEKTI